MESHVGSLSDHAAVAGKGMLFVSGGGGEAEVPRGKPWHRGIVCQAIVRSQRESPRGKPVASRNLFVRRLLEANVSHHGASPWHRGIVGQAVGSGEHEVPRGKPVASRNCLSGGW